MSDEIPLRMERGYSTWNMEVSVLVHRLTEVLLSTRQDGHRRTIMDAIDYIVAHPPEK